MRAEIAKNIKEKIDMSFNIVNQDGSVSQVAGNGKAEYGASTVRRGTVTVSADTSTNYVTSTVTFADAMPDSNYDVTIYMTGENGYNVVQWIVQNKSATGFQVTCATVDGQYFQDSSHSFTFSYTAFKLYTDLDYNRILSAMPTSASSSNKLATSSDVNGLSSLDYPIVNAGSESLDVVAYLRNNLPLNRVCNVRILGTNLTNAPFSDGDFVYTVYKTQYYDYYRVVAYDERSANAYVGFYNGGTFSGWQKLVTESDINQIGYHQSIVWTRPENGWTLVEGYVDQPYFTSITIPAGVYIIVGYVIGDVNTASGGYIYAPWLAGGFISGWQSSELGAQLLVQEQTQTYTPILRMNTFNPLSVHYDLIQIK